MGNIIQVGMAEVKFALAPDKLLTAGLGSCIGICIYDKQCKLGVLAHIMLPSSTQAKVPFNKAKFADTAIEMAVTEMEKRGAKNNRMIAKIAGGAQMFKLSNESSIMKIGERNAVSVEEVLDKYGIYIAARDTGGNYGRTIIFDPDSGDLCVRTIGCGERII